MPQTLSPTINAVAMSTRERAAAARNRSGSRLAVPHLIARDDRDAAGVDPLRVDMIACRQGPTS
jgi:hypothetical protein